jgi:hypothetical protein
MNLKLVENHCMTITPVNDIFRFFELKKKHVLTFAGFGELGYQDISFVEGIIRKELCRWKPDEVLINSGTLLRVGGQEGIAMVYRLAKELGIETCGIHPSVSFQWADTHPVSPFSDHVYFVEDATWGGYLDDQFAPSPTLKVLLAVTDELIVIGGGKHAADELAAFLQNGKCVKYFPAQMNHQVTKKWCVESGVDIPDLNGATYNVWLQMMSDV